MTIPNSITHIDYGVFSGCSSLKNVTIPNSVTLIDWYAFKNCSNLSSVTIGSSVNKISSEAFDGCYELTTLYSLNTTPPSVSSGNFTNKQYGTLNVYVPQESLGAYLHANVWKEFWNLQGFDPTGIENVKTDSGIDAIYTLDGTKLNTTSVSDLPKGIYIINGKKVMIK